LIILLVLFIDQFIKIYIKTHFALGEEYKIAPWFIIHFTENNGMAFGMQLAGSYGKILLSVFRIAAVIATGLAFFTTFLATGFLDATFLAAGLAFLTTFLGVGFLDATFFAAFFSAFLAFFLSFFFPILS